MQTGPKNDIPCVQHSNFVKIIYLFFMDYVIGAEKQNKKWYASERMHVSHNKPSN